MLLFGILFVLCGYYIPRIYLEYFDKTVYYTMDLPVTVDKDVYCAGDVMKLSSSKGSLLDARLDITGELVLIKIDSLEEVYRASEAFPTTKGSEDFITAIKLPDDLEAGSYKWQGVVNYSVKGVDKVFVWYSEEFVIIEHGEINS